MVETTSNQRRTALVVLPRLSRGGAEVVLCTVARELADDAQWDVLVASMGGRDQVITDVGKARLRILNGSGKLGTEWRLLQLIRKQRYDLVLSSHVRVNAALSLLRRVGLLRTDRLVTRESTVFSDRASRPLMLAYRVLYSLYGGQDLLIAQTDYMAAKLRDVVSRRLHAAIRVLPNPIDSPRIRHLAQQKPDGLDARAPFRIAWCGRMVEIKQPLLAVEVVHTLRADLNVDADLVMIGDGPLRATVQARIAELGLHEHVKLTGQLDNPYAVMGACRYGLLTSSREGFPNVLLEMIATGVERVITTDCTDGLKVLPGVTVAGATAHALALALRQAMERKNGNDGEVELLLKERAPRRFADWLLDSSATPYRS